jgi:pimeloyl-ACP methyl ester carboxylesterase
MRQADILDQPWVHAAGAGEPAVLVHGVYPGSPASFAGQWPLADAFRLIAVDRRGYGANPDPGGRLGWPADAEDLLRLVEALGGAHLVGHSYGGVVVGLAAGRRPDLVRSLVLVDPSLHSVAPDDPAVAAMTEAERAVAEVAASGVSTREWARAWMVTVVGADPVGADRFLDHWGEADWRMLEVVRREAPATAAPVDYDALAAAAFPKVLVVGASPPPTAPGGDRYRRLAEALTGGLSRRVGAEVVVFERSTHFPPSEEPERFNRLLRATWAAAAGRPAPA